MALLGIDTPRGTRRAARVALGSYADGAPLELPVVVLRGQDEGPVVYVQAGLHGDELTGIEVCRRALRELDPHSMSGTVVCVPLANPASHRSRTRGAAIEERGPIDANRVFPGSDTGLLSERVVHVLFHEFVIHADFVLDLHSALEGCTIAPFVYVDPDDNSTGTLPVREAAARAFGTPYLYYKGRGQKLGTSDMAHSLRAQADAAGVPAISVEMGESQRVTSEYVSLGVSGVHNLLRHLGIEPGRPKDAVAARRFTRITLVHSRSGGQLHWSTELMDDVRRGQVLAEVLDVFGDPVERVEAPTDGFLLRKMLFGAIATGAEVAWIGS